MIALGVNYFTPDRHSVLRSMGRSPVTRGDRTTTRSSKADYVT